MNWAITWNIIIAIHYNWKHVNQNFFFVLSRKLITFFFLFSPSTVWCLLSLPARLASLPSSPQILSYHSWQCYSVYRLEPSGENPCVPSHKNPADSFLISLAKGFWFTRSPLSVSQKQSKSVKLWIKMGWGSSSVGHYWWQLNEDWIQRIN